MTYRIQSLLMAFILGASLGGVEAAQTLKPNEIAVIVVDVQGDFTDYGKDHGNGSLAVKGTGADYIKKVQKETKQLTNAGLQLFFTQDWHPEGHVSFASTHGKKFTPPAPEVIKIKHEKGDSKMQALWPDHCVQCSEGANILIDTTGGTIVKKGSNLLYDSYSGFEDDGGSKTPLAELLRKKGVKAVVVYGIALDYCVSDTAKDAKKENFDVHLITDLSRGVTPESSEQAIKTMKAAGIVIHPTVENFMKVMNNRKPAAAGSNVARLRALYEKGKPGF